MIRVGVDLKTLLICEFIVIANTEQLCAQPRRTGYANRSDARNQPAWTPAIALRAEQECKRVLARPC